MKHERFHKAEYFNVYSSLKKSYTRFVSKTHSLYLFIVSKQILLNSLSHIFDILFYKANIREIVLIIF